MAKSEFIITLNVTMDITEDNGYIHPTGWRWPRMVQRHVPHATNVEVLNCSPITHEEAEPVGWDTPENLEAQRRAWEEERG